MLKAAERVTDEIALDQSDLADLLVRVGALGAGSARDHTTVYCVTKNFSPRSLPSSPTITS